MLLLFQECQAEARLERRGKSPQTKHLVEHLLRQLNLSQLTQMAFLTRSNPSLRPYYLALYQPLHNQWSLR